MRMLSLFALAATVLVSCGQGTNDAGSPSAPLAAASPPAGTEWVTTVAETTDGGFRMGNPAAAIRLVEYGSLTCPHCAEFSKAGTEKLAAKYVSSGKVSYEFRTFVRDPVDVTASLLARCSGPSSFFSLVEAMYADQTNWLGKVEALPSQTATELATLAPTEQVRRYAVLTGLKDFVRARGLPVAQADACLNDPKAAERLLSVQQQAAEQFQIQATPTFLINNQLITDVATWEAVERELQARGA